MELLANEGPNKIMDESAHAWAEIYIDGAGWIPIEVTPGFINEEDMKDDRDPSSLDSEDIPDVTDPEEQTEEPTTEEVQTTEHPTVEGEFHTEEPTTEPPTTSAQKPTKPTQPTQPSTSASENEEQEDNHELLWLILKIVLIVMAVILFIALVLYLIGLQYRRRLAKMNACFERDPREGILAALDMIERISEGEGLLLCENASWEQVAEKYPFVDQETFFWLQSIALEAVYSKHSFEPEVRDDIVAFYREFAGYILEQSSGVRRLYLRYVKAYI